MNRDEVLLEVARRLSLMTTGTSDLEQASVVLDFLDSIGYQMENEPNEPSYAEAGMSAVADGMASFYLTLRAKGVPEQAATTMSVVFMNNVQTPKS